MTDEERLEELQQKREETNRALDELRNLNEVRKLLGDIHNEMLAEIVSLQKRIRLQNELVTLKGKRE